MLTDRLSSLDVSFLCLERSEAPMHIGAVAVFTSASRTDPEALTQVIAERARRIRRLRQVVRPTWLPPGGAAWVEDPGFDPAWHVRHRRLPAPGTRDDLAAEVAGLMSTPLDRSRPLWEVHLLTGLVDGGFALLLKLHHALADGLRALQIGASLVDGPSEACAYTEDAPADPGAFLARGAGEVLAWSRQLLDPRAVTDMPRLVTDTVPRLAGHTYAAATSVLQVALAPAPGSPVNGQLGRARQFAVATVGLDDVRRVRKEHGGMVHDVLLATVAGALRRWLLAHWPDTDGPDLRVMVPVSRRRRGDGGGNRLAWYVVDLPVGEPDPVVRLHRVRAAMERSKAAGPAAGPGVIALLADRLPPVVHRVATPWAGRLAPRLCNMMVTSVPIPNVPFRLGDAELRELFPVPPLAPGQRIGFGISTYRGVAHFGINADHATVPDLPLLAKAIPVALAELLE
ncbi:hypothetical protein TH66_17590 [Carbonactinospora thermoautotrophica]|uniref:Diacylglycerol O-acyltransferase n=2 Tax=Carbonactinospora thermoautotrophica TaxID=1469144 RepID=A0A132MI01_9ACTN|nr:wax ester/triacylglycerol synthase family O-acyltransferase [Carbonactinospora thermoautotrophica]KWW97458.1 hypothetical protein TH66_17590 [Carbonactinospora thermoautotrophica]